VAYGPSRINLVYNGHTVEGKEDVGSYLTLGGTRYELAQFHFHSPSEHTVDGKYAAMEMHLVHKSASNEVAVVGVFLEPGEADNPAFADVWAYLPDASNRSRTSERTVDVGAMLPQDRTAYAYEGSFTTPPCTEGVEWLVLTDPVRLSQGQIDTFRAILMGNNRPTQDLHGREVAVTRD
jgi:carbonic anhydrase